MNIFFVTLIVISSIVLIFNSPDLILTSLIEGSKNGINLAISLLAIYALWLSLLNLMEKIGLNKLIYKIFKPLVKLLFKGESDLALEYITLNFSANLLGMGSAATPLGLKAMEYLHNKDDDYASDNMILFIVINATSIQLLPTTIISLRASGGSTNPSDIIFPSLISTTIATIFGILICYLLKGIKKGNHND